MHKSLTTRLVSWLARAAFVAPALALGVVLSYGQNSLLPVPKQQFLDANGRPLASGRVYNYVPNSSSFKTTFTNPGGTTSNTNPIVLDAAGRATIYGQGAYRQVIQTSAGATLVDGLTASTGGTSTIYTDALPVGSMISTATTVPPTNWMFTAGQTVSRTTYSALFNAITYTEEPVVVSGSATISGLATTGQIRVGMPLEGSCFAPNTTVSTIVSSSSVTVSSNATSNGLCTIRLFPFGNGDGFSTFRLPDMRGRVPAGRDNLGGTAASILSYQYCNNAPGRLGLGSLCGTQALALQTGNLPPYTPTGTVAVTNGEITPRRIAGAQAGANFDSLVNSAIAPVAAIPQAASTAIFTGVAQGGTTTPFTNIPPVTVLNYIIKYASSAADTSGVISVGGMFGDILCGTGVTCVNGTISFIAPTVPTGTTLRVLDYAACDGSTVDTLGFINLAAVASAAQVWTIDFPKNGDCVIWNNNTDAAAHPLLMLISNAKQGTINFNGSRFHSLYTGNFQNYTIRLSNSANVIINDYAHKSERGKQNGGAGDSGVIHVQPYNGSHNITINGMTATGGQTGVDCERGVADATPRSYDIFANINVTDVFYPANFQNDCDSVRGIFRSYNAGRPYFPYNVKDHKVTVIPTNQTEQILVKVFTTALDVNSTTGIDITVIDTQSTTCSVVPLDITWQPANVALTPVGGNIDLNLNYIMDTTHCVGSYQELLTTDTFTSSAGVLVRGDPGHTGNIVITGQVTGDFSNYFMHLGTAALGFGSGKYNIAVQNFHAPSVTKPIFIGLGPYTVVSQRNLIAPGALLRPDGVTADQYKSNFWNPGNVINAAEHGVICDGTTDTTDAINALEQPNVTIQLPTGVCVVTRVQLPSNGLTLRGRGGSGATSSAGCLTTLKRKDNYTGYVVVMGGTHQTFSDICVDGNGPGQSAEVDHPEIISDGSIASPNTLTRFSVFNTYSTTGVVLSNFANNITNCKVTGPASTAPGDYRGFVGLQGQNTGNITNVSYCHVSYMTGPGVSQGQGTIGPGNVFDHNHNMTNPSGGGQINPNYTNLVIGNIIQDGGPGASGIEAVGRNMMIGNYIARHVGVAGIFFEYGDDTDPSVQQIAIGNIFEGNDTAVSSAFNKTGAILSDNKFYNNTLAINLNPGNDYYVITGNVCQANASGVVNSSAMTHNIIQNNNGCGGDTAPTFVPAQFSYTKVINFASANTDTLIPISLPYGYTRYLVSQVRLSGASANISGATAGMFTGAAGAGTAIVTGASAITVTSAADGTANNAQLMTLATGSNISFLVGATPNLYFRVAASAAATASATLVVVPLP